jgi:hypothetical protein
MEYIIVEGASIKDLMEAVNFNMENGYAPIGGMVAEVYQGYAPKYYQSMAKVHSVEGEMEKMLNIEFPKTSKPNNTINLATHVAREGLEDYAPATNIIPVDPEPKSMLDTTWFPNVKKRGRPSKK